MADRVKCTKCGIRKRRSQFYAHPSKRNGLQSSCIQCSRQAYRERRAPIRLPANLEPEPQSALSRGSGKGNPSRAWLDTLPFWPADLDLRDPRKLKLEEV